MRRFAIVAVVGGGTVCRGRQADPLLRRHAQARSSGHGRQTFGKAENFRSLESIRKSLAIGGLDGEPCWVRTSDLLIKSQLL
ncbi:MAG TPA: hypothetical protein PKJ55_14095, partial [Novosphingobium sp.]|nr:hypothetical protein [Novosphingobium sp.]HQE00907.1 hypothetical protein [Novosphingobium sp.]